MPHRKTHLAQTRSAEIEQITRNIWRYANRHKDPFHYRINRINIHQLAKIAGIDIAKTHHYQNLHSALTRVRTAFDKRCEEMLDGQADIDEYINDTELTYAQRLDNKLRSMYNVDRMIPLYATWDTTNNEYRWGTLTWQEYGPYTLAMGLIKNTAYLIKWSNRLITNTLPVSDEVRQIAQDYSNKLPPYLDTLKTALQEEKARQHQQKALPEPDEENGDETNA